MHGFTRLVCSIILLKSVAAFQFDVGRGVCPGGSCQQCSPVVYHAEKALLVSITKLAGKLNVFQSKLISQIGSLNYTVNTVNIAQINSLHAYSNEIGAINSKLVYQINQLIALLANYDRSGLDRINVLIVNIKQMQNVIHAASKNLISIALQIIAEHEKFDSLTTERAQRILASINENKKLLIQISEIVLSYISKLDQVLSLSNSAFISLKSVRVAIAELKERFVALIQFQQNIVKLLQITLTEQKRTTSDLKSQISSLSVSANVILERTAVARSHSLNYFSVLKQIHVNTKSMFAVIASYDALIKEYQSQLSSVSSRLSAVYHNFNKAYVSITNVPSELQILINIQLKLFKDITDLTAFVQNEERIMLGYIKKAREVINIISLKLRAIKVNEVENHNFIRASMASIQTDVNNVRQTAESNRLVASALAAEMTTLEERMHQIMQYLKGLRDQCNQVPTPSPPALCEGKRYNNCPQAKVCASDGKTYNSKCDMMKVACIMRTVIEFVSDGPCPVPTVATTTTLSPKCAFTCEPIIQPVCASDGKTYSCPCSMKLRACHQGITLYVVRQGPCEAPPVTKKPSSPCDLKCPLVVSPVCGSDGVTYTSNCYLMQASCLTKKVITKEKDGKCGEKCATGWVELNGRCYYFYSPAYGKSRATAYLDCKQRGANLASFSNDLEWKAVGVYLTGLYPSTMHYHYWTAAKCYHSKWSWDGYPYDFHLNYAWYNNQIPYIGYNRQACGALTGSYLYKLSAYSCTDTYASRYYGWICLK